MINNQEKEITIPISLYIELIKAENYLSNWTHDIVSCKTCGELNPKGCVCISCGDDCPTRYD